VRSPFRIRVSLQCSEFSSNFQATPSCAINSTHITVRGGVPREDLTRDKGSLVFKVSGIRNPRSLKTTASLTIDTFDSKGFMIEFKYDMVTVAMQEVSKVANAQVTPSAKVVGGLATYTF
jgi:hypothetical protein